MGGNVFLTFFVSILQLLQKSNANVVWEYGLPNENYLIVGKLSGAIGLFDKNIQIPVAVPACMQLKYIRVEINNHLAKPFVAFNQYSNTVIITYDLFQISASTYDIVAMGQRHHRCISRNLKLQKLNSNPQRLLGCAPN